MTDNQSPLHGLSAEEAGALIEAALVGSVIRREGNATVIELAEFPPPSLIRMDIDRVLELLTAAGFVEATADDVRLIGE